MNGHIKMIKESVIHMFEAGSHLAHFVLCYTFVKIILSENETSFDISESSHTQSLLYSLAFRGNHNDATNE